MNVHFLGAGTNYVGQECQLRGCVADAASWASLFRDEIGSTSLVTLIGPEATGRQIRAEVVGMLNAAKDGDEFNLQLSMHGTKIPSVTELDGDDEAIYPDDGDIITDNWMATVFSAYPRIRINVFADLCYSGGMERDPLRAARPRRIVLPLERIQEARANMKAYRLGRGVTSGCVRWFAASREDEPALDVDIPYGDNLEGPHGAFTWAALTSYMEYHPKRAIDWHHWIRARLPSAQYDQHPQLLGAPWARRASIFNFD